MASIQPEEFALHSGRIEGAMALAADSMGPMPIQRKGRL